MLRRGRCAAALQASIVILALAATTSCHIHGTPPSTPAPVVPSTGFLDHYAATLSSTLLIKNHLDTDAARADMVLIADVARRYVAAIASKKIFNPPNLVTSIANTQIYQIADQFGNLLAEYLPSHIGLDRFASNYTQSVLPGLTTALTGLSYSPCLLSGTGLGAIAGATGIGISPKVFNTGPVGAAAVAEAISIAPTLIYSTQTGATLAAIGVDIAPALITISPTKYIYAREGLAVAPDGISVVFAASPAPAAAGPGAAPSPLGGPSARQPVFGG